MKFNYYIIGAVSYICEMHSVTKIYTLKLGSGGTGLQHSRQR